ncbi:hemolymph trypsin inhibitor B [Galleria mellonella]|uniref:Hemolymph trypsin inhibitor B n=1 Tax=Galleria mellonella TaxID=7137 RepID=Q968S8_GALME|nr:hemolymph trypsin inhibitor B [Galleria mellonella]AAK40037.1 silk protease inhibitor 1 precursor [Galleria mellonella]
MYKFIALIVILFIMYNICNGDDDICSLPLKTGPCRAAFQRYGYVEGKGCVLFTYGGCQGNANNFETLEACKNACEN